MCCLALYLTEVPQQTYIKPIMPHFTTI